MQAPRRSGRASKPSTRLQHLGEDAKVTKSRESREPTRSRSPDQAIGEVERHDSAATVADEGSVVQETTPGVETKENSPVPVVERSVEELIERVEDVYAGACFLMSMRYGGKM